MITRKRDFWPTAEYTTPPPNQASIWLCLLGYESHLTWQILSQSHGGFDVMHRWSCWLLQCFLYFYILQTYVVSAPCTLKSVLTYYLPVDTVWCKGVTFEGAIYMPPSWKVISKTPNFGAGIGISSSYLFLLLMVQNQQIVICLIALKNEKLN